MFAGLADDVDDVLLDEGIDVDLLDRFLGPQQLFDADDLLQGVDGVLVLLPVEDFDLFVLLDGRWLVGLPVDSGVARPTRQLSGVRHPHDLPVCVSDGRGGSDSGLFWFAAQSLNSHLPCPKPNND